MTAPNGTLDALLDRLHTSARRLGLMVDVTYAPAARRHWVSAYNPLQTATEVLVDRDTCLDAVTTALAEMELLTPEDVVR